MPALGAAVSSVLFVVRGDEFPGRESGVFSSIAAIGRGRLNCHVFQCFMGCAFWSDLRT